jgi:ABC-2 type transport system ATP-binding protein
MGKTVIFSSHLLEQVEEVADRVAIFSLGKKVLEGSIDSLLTQDEGTQINLPDVTAEQQQRLRQALAQAGLNADAARFTRPRLSLEQLYLRTVQHRVGSLTEEPNKK